MNTSAEDVFFFGYERLLKVHLELLEKAEGVISKLHTLVTSVSYHVARSKPLRMTGSNLIFHKRNERANNHDYGLLLNGSLIQDQPRAGDSSNTDSSHSLWAEPRTHPFLSKTG